QEASQAAEGRDVTRGERLPGERLTLPLAPGVELVFAWVPPGSFLMGSPRTEEDHEDDEWRHKVTLGRGFYLGAYPITQAQWEAVTGETPSAFKGGDRPVDSVSWEDCVRFCRRLGEKTGRRFRLPTEAEWEYACRAGTATAYYFGDDPEH